MQLEVQIETMGVPKKDAVNKKQKESEFYELGRKSAQTEVESSLLDTKRNIADLYASVILAQTKNFLNTALLDVYRALAQVKAESTFIKTLLAKLAPEVPSLTPYVGPPNVPMNVLDLPIPIGGGEGPQGGTEEGQNSPPPGMPMMGGMGSMPPEMGMPPGPM